MTNRILYPILVVIVLASAVAGYGFAGLDDQKQIDAALAAVTPAPTPLPTPIPTPLIVTVAPPECAAAIDTLFTQSLPDLQFIVDVYSAYLDHPGESLTDLGRRVEALLKALAAPPSQADTAELQRKVEVCRAAP